VTEAVDGPEQFEPDGLPSNRLVPLLQLLSVWARAGTLTFGGGSSLLYVYTSFVERRSWISRDTWGEYWALCQVTPGVNLFALAYLIGNRLAGPKGALGSILAFVAPSATLTIAIAAIYQELVRFQVVQSGIKGLVAAAAGAVWLVSWRMGEKPARSSRSMGWRTTAAAALVVVVSAVLVLTGITPVFAMILIGGAVMAGARVVTHERIPGA